ncbi:MAG: hypothetical protein DRQ03_03485 [Candidatus Hydrothermota bacterium]|nr:MAG: hypothetical protein DRQ03_03485 [Candidatus Hydrothermae bacterium]
MFIIRGLGRRYYERFAMMREYAFLFPILFRWRKRVWKAIIDEIPREAESIAEIGCGVGSFSAYIKRKFGNKMIYGIDSSCGAIHKAKERYSGRGIIFLRENFFNLNEKFDCVVSVHVFILFDVKEFYKQLKRILSPDGTAILSFTLPTPFTRLHRIFYKIVVGDDIVFKEPDFLLQQASAHGFSSYLKKIDWSEGSFLLKLKI